MLNIIDTNLCRGRIQIRRHGSVPDAVTELTAQQVGNAKLTGLCQGLAQRQILFKQVTHSKQTLKAGRGRSRASLRRKGSEETKIVKATMLSGQYGFNHLACMRQQQRGQSLINRLFGQELTSGDQSPMVKGYSRWGYTLPQASQIDQGGHGAVPPAASMGGSRKPPGEPHECKGCLARIKKRLPCLLGTAIGWNPLTQKGSITTLHGQQTSSQLFKNALGNSLWG